MGRKSIDESQIKKSVSIGLKYELLEDIDKLVDNRSEFIAEAILHYMQYLEEEDQKNKKIEK